MLILASNVHDVVINVASNWFDKLEEQDDTPSGFRPTELPYYKDADKYFAYLFWDNALLLEFLKEPMRIQNQYYSIKDDIFQRVYEGFLNIAFYFLLIHVSGRKISKIKKPDDYSEFSTRSINLILHGKNFSLAPEIIELLRSIISKRIPEPSHIPEIQLLCAVFFTTNDNGKENFELLKKIKNVGYKIQYLMYQVAYHRTHPEMDIDDFLENYIPLKLLTRQSLF